MINTHNLTKSFGPRAALVDVDLDVEAGESVTLVGPNGAGKTTLLRILATLARPSGGSVRIAGLDPAKNGEQARRLIGFLSHHTLLYDDLTAEQNLNFYAQMYDLDDASVRITNLLEQVGLA
ncbi:MAG: ABC transporter ATP-binding protein, partial [Chloroflexota bacterium]|nr:ABC transporter ATP-binding protein [Chloroflexota bacterium]